MARFRIALMAVLATALIACSSAPPAQRPTSTFPSPQATEYAVVTTLATDKKGATKICAAIFLTEPPQCEGIALRGIDVRTIPGNRPERDGSRWVSAVRITGTWDGHAITATRSAEVVDQKYSTRIQDCSAGPSEVEDPIQLRMQKDWEALINRGIYVIDSKPCKDGVQVTVAIADPPTVSYMTNTYGPRYVLGWFQPLTA
jgi:hypothetical protein